MRGRLGPLDTDKGILLRYKYCMSDAKPPEYQGILNAAKLRRMYSKLPAGLPPERPEGPSTPSDASDETVLDVKPQQRTGDTLRQRLGLPVSQQK